MAQKAFLPALPALQRAPCITPNDDQALPPQTRGSRKRQRKLIYLTPQKDLRGYIFSESMQGGVPTNLSVIPVIILPFQRLTIYLLPAILPRKIPTLPPEDIFPQTPA